MFRVDDDNGVVVVLNFFCPFGNQSASQGKMCFSEGEFVFAKKESMRFEDGLGPPELVQVIAESLNRQTACVHRAIGYENEVLM